MKRTLYLYATLLALPLIGLSFYLLHPPQCPPGYTQAQVDASRCVVGANIGGTPLFIISVPILWMLCAWAVRRMLKKRQNTR